MTDNFEQFEFDIMQRIIAENGDLVDSLGRQYAASKVISREFTGFGFYTSFEILDKSLRLENKANLELGNAEAMLAGLKYGMGFVLFIRDGFIKTLEGYTYDEPLPFKFFEYSFK